MLLAAKDALGNVAQIGTGSLSGSTVRSTVTDLDKQETQIVQDNHGNVIREIRRVKNTSGEVTKVLLTLHEYGYAPVAPSFSRITSMTDKYDAIRRLLGFWHPSVLELGPPAEHELIERTDQELGVRLPRSMREWLEEHNGIKVNGVFEWFGVPSRPLMNNRLATIPILDFTRHWETVFRQNPPVLDPPANDLAIQAASKVVAIASPMTGDAYVLLAGRSDHEEYPVAEVDHETNHLTVAASSYYAFLKFSLEQLVKWYSPTGEFREGLDPHGYHPWLRDYRWMLNSDPGLATWINVSPDINSG